ncbi:MAG: hypothetical protein NZ895_02820 [Archaeoglobaceae archaeon]|nr:hypothetical protein [Archaeoglobaceae archaeon]MCX8151852.1 hypothetical protein [Archaeoglobaceae archaeon]MDW8014316.1 hypothetical protein [Archaeoglobaceae archaeon]
MDRNKLKSMIAHWIEHSKEHTAKYYEWAEKLSKDLPEVSELLIKAAKYFEEGEKYLEQASKKI